MAEDKARFNKRSLTSLMVTLGFIVLAFTGSVLYATPKGRVAHWTRWTFWGLEKEEWSAVHMVIALVFLISALFHIYFNWRVLLRYFKGAFAKGLRAKREFALAALITVLCCVGTVQMWPPFGTIIAWNDQIKDYWERRSAPAPYPHAEDSTLAQFATKIGLTPQELRQRLASEGYEAGDLSVTVNELAHKYAVTPAQLFRAISKPKTDSGGASGAGQSRGTGYGRMTVEGICKQHGLDVTQALRRLEQNGVDADRADTLRHLSEQTEMTPGHLASVILGEP